MPPDPAKRDVVLRVPPCWTIRHEASGQVGPGIELIVEEGAGFGSGAHPTTQVCLQAIRAFAPREAREWRMLDFGSGSGILAVAAAKLGASVDAIEIDEAALTHARRNAHRNGVASRIRLAQRPDGHDGPYDLIVANILRAVLLEVAEGLTSRLSPRGALVLSGLVASDVPELSVRYAALLGGRRPEVYERGDWRALAWRPEG